MNIIQVFLKARSIHPSRQAAAELALALTVPEGASPSAEDCARLANCIAGTEDGMTTDQAVDLVRGAWIAESHRRYNPTCPSAHQIHAARQALANREDAGEYYALCVCDIYKSETPSEWTLYTVDGDKAATAHGMACEVLTAWRAEYPLATIKAERRNTQGEHVDPEEEPYSGDEYSSSRKLDREDFHSDG